MGRQKKRKPNGKKRWVVRAQKGVVTKKRVKKSQEVIAIGRRVMPLTDLTTLQIVHLSETRQQYIQNMGGALVKDLARLKKKGLVTWDRSRITKDVFGPTRSVAGLRLTPKGFDFFTKATKMTPARVFGPMKKNPQKL